MRSTYHTHQVVAQAADEVTRQGGSWDGCSHLDVGGRGTTKHYVCLAPDPDHPDCRNCMAINGPYAD